ncbi:aminoacyl tRNA synthase complex-interacting multifunctional protein 2-like [Pollicipes pollicipes]|uniref:aminoacyl tRNA synthase complex-interacting multifunctional protein 2-like n=1 Tax=Pollicipes pollicipes TaxID=41117 RepID=UPI001885A3F3|nr:aminoacyl tRNA synthase complex-interacting multifunctional protein 2-like [Pollicipes pollicipes]
MASSMYHLPWIIDNNVAITLPSCMYRMTPIIAGLPDINCDQKDAGKLSASTDTAASDLAQLERRQDTILARLAALKGQVETARQQLGASSSVAATMATPPSQLPALSGDVVVVASPSRPPHSLLLLRRLVPALSLTSHVHSTAPPVADALGRLFRWRGADGGPHLRLIWKQVSGEPQLLVSADQPCPLVGEDQLCRFLARSLLPGHYEAGGEARAARVDQLLEEGGQLLHGAGKQRQAALRSLDAVLARQPYLLGSELTLVDAAVWSALRAAALQSPPSVTAWGARLAVAAGLGVDTGAARVSVALPSEPRADARPAAQRAPAATAPAAPSAAPPPPPAGGHMNQPQLLAFLERLGIATETISHPAVFTVEAMMPHLARVKGAVTKNLFLRDKKKQLYLLSARHDVEFRLTDLARRVPGAKEFRFGDEEVMLALLGVRQGCVTALALANDGGKAVRFLVDSKLMDGTFDKLWFHPLSNEATTGLSVGDFKKFLAATEHEPVLVDL